MIVQEIFRNIVRGLFKVLDLDSPYSAKEYGPNWSKQRQKCLERDEYTCQVCSVRGDELNRELAVHHITPRRKFDDNWGQNRLSNLIALCPSCHGTFEGKFIDSSPSEFAAQARQEI